MGVNIRNAQIRLDINKYQNLKIECPNDGCKQLMEIKKIGSTSVLICNICNLNYIVRLIPVDVVGKTGCFGIKER